MATTPSYRFCSGAGSRGGDAGPAQQGLNPRHELHEAEGLRDIVVAAGPEALGDLGWSLRGRHEQDGRVRGERMSAQLAAELQAALRAATIDGAAVTTEEYLSLEPDLQSTNLFMSFIGGQYTEEYLLLVRADSGISDLGGLSGRKLILFDNPRASLAPLWLEVILAENKLGPPTDHFGKLLTAGKLAKVVLPVFFHQQDACIVTRRGFETMCELNPQVRTQLRVILTSPKLVPAVGFIRPSYHSPLRESLLAALQGLETSAAGTQVLTLFQSDELREAPASLLDSARDLLAAHRHLEPPATSETKASPPAQSGPQKFGNIPP